MLESISICAFDFGYRFDGRRRFRLRFELLRFALEESGGIDDDVDIDTPYCRVLYSVIVGVGRVKLCFFCFNMFVWQHCTFAVSL